MECTKNLDTKYQNLATEYSKLRANAAVLKKAVLDEQQRSRELKEQLKEHEQRLRKSNQEMESLTFRNQQLTKRISVLQEELDNKTHGKKTKNKNTDVHTPVKTNVTLLDEELQKKIIDNAQLISAMTDKDLEISNLREIIAELEEKLLDEQKQKLINEQRHTDELKEIMKQHIMELKLTESRINSAGSSGDQEIRQNGEILSDRGSILSSDDGISDMQTQNNILKQQLYQAQNQAEHWKTEYDLLVSKNQEDNVEEEPDCERRTKDYFYKRIDQLMAEKQLVEGMANSLTSECSALQFRLELSLDEKSTVEEKLESSMNTIGKLQEELQTTSHNYEQQLSTMSEHLADLNDKYTEQGELIQQLQFQLKEKSSKKNAK